MRLILIFILLFHFGQCYWVFGQKRIKKNPIVDSIQIYESRKNHEKVVSFSTYYLQKYAKKKKASQPEKAQVLQSLGDALRRTGKIIEAEPLLLQSLEIRKQVFGAPNALVANSLSSLGNLYNVMGNFSLAEFYYTKVLEMRRLVFGENDQSVATTCHSLGQLYARNGRYSESEINYTKSLEIGRKLKGDDHISLADSYNGLGVLFNEIGNFQKAESFLIKAIEIWENNYGVNHIELAYPYNNLGNLFEKLGNYAKAETYLQKSLNIYLKAYNNKHQDIADCYNNLGVLYLEMGNLKNAEVYFLKSLDIKSEFRTVGNTEMADSYLNLGNFYYTIGNFSKSREKYLKSLEIYKNNLREDHPYIADVYNNLASIYYRSGDYINAEAYYLNALDLFIKNFGESHSNVASSYSRLGLLNLENGFLDKAETYYLKFEKMELDILKRYFPFLSDDEKEKFLAKEKNYINLFKTFCLLRCPGNQSITAELYNHQLATKGILLNSSSKWRHRIKSSGNVSLTSLFEKWSENQNKLIQFMQSTSTEKLRIDSLQMETEKMEKTLSLISQNFSKLAEKVDVTWKDIQKKLKMGEAAVEIIRIQKFGVKGLVEDTIDNLKRTFQEKGLTDTILYAALIIQKTSSFPELVILENGNELESKHLGYYKKCIQKRIADKSSYTQFWDKIGVRLNGIKRVYISPDGVYHKINLNTLQNPHSKQYLLDEKDIRLVTVTKDLEENPSNEPKNKEALLFGFPRYFRNMSDAAYLPDSIEVTKFKNRARKSKVTLNELPATQSEVKKVGYILASKGWKTSNFLAQNASEENMKTAFQPFLLHIATHGFFYGQDSTKAKDPLLRSGLMLANAGETLNGNKPLAHEDGILTSAEAMNLNLDNTELVVLSACETGLGEVKNGEGVYGLQRAFKVAGAKSIIMSLWKVSDEATQELMVSFYKHWLGPLSSGPTQPTRKGGVNTANSDKTKVSNSDKQSLPLGYLKGLDLVGRKRIAFLKAQKELKDKYPDPFYWGAFVMVGD